MRKWISCLLLCFSVAVLRAQDPMEFAPFMMQFGGPTDWELRVLANGGAQPSQNTINCMETLRLGCISAGLTNKIYSLCVFVPDSLIAATTPLFKHFGADPWTNINFLVGDLTISGLVGNGTTKVLDTAIKAKDIQIEADGSTVGLTVIVSESAGNAAEFVAGQQDADLNPVLGLLVSSAGETQWFATEPTAGTSATSNDFARVGYVSGNRWIEGGTTNVALFVASPLEAHKVLASTAGSIAAIATVTDDTISVFANKHSGTNRSWSSQRLSLAMVHDGLTAAESAAFWALALACRECLGGGTGDPVHDWNRKIVAAGGADVSTTSSNAARTFLSGLDTDGTLYRMVAVNAFVPDNLTAARTPIIWQAGSEVWTNINFGSTNLTTGGLTGNGTTKLLGTGIITSTAVNRGFSLTSAGISLIISTNPSSGDYDFGVDGVANSQQFALLNNAGQAIFYCFRFVTVNANFLTAPAGFSTGFLSGNRTAANAIALYGARSDTAHFAITNGTGNQDGSLVATYPMTAFALNADGTPTAFSDHTLSFLALHSGLTQTQSSNVWNRVRDFRTAVGAAGP